MSAAGKRFEGQYENSLNRTHYQLTYLQARKRFIYFINEFLVSKETVVLRRWERSKQKFGFIKRVDKG